MRQSFLTTLAWAALPFGVAPARAQTTFPVGHTFYNNLSYVAGGTSRQVLDLYVPAGAGGPLPVVLFVHGGGWSSGSAESYLDLWSGLGQGTFALAAMNYRLNTVVEPLVSQVDDVKAAIRFLRAQAGTYGLDAARLGLMGQSAGAHLAGWAALTPTTTFFGSSGDLANTQNLSQSVAAVAMVGWALPPGAPSGSSTFDLSSYVSLGDPDFRLFHSTQDETVNISFVRTFRDTLNTAGVGGNLTELSGPHFPTLATTAAFAPAIVAHFNAEFAAVPEPAWAALLPALAAAQAARRRRRPAP